MEIRVYSQIKPGNSKKGLPDSELKAIHTKVNERIIKGCFGRKSLMGDHELSVERAPVISTDEEPFIRILITGATFKPMRDFVAATKTLLAIAQETGSNYGIEKRIFVAFKEFVSSDQEFELQID